MTLLFWIVRLVIIILVVRMVVQLFSGRTRVGRGRQPRQAPRPQERLGGTLVRDPHCGTYVPQDRAIAVGSAPDLVYFCSPGCRDAWKVARRA
jgi:hypothetical protein